MGRRILMGMLSVVPLTFAPAAPGGAAAIIGAVNGRGTVQVNGVPAPNGTNIYAGNRIATGPGAVAIVALARGGKLAFGGSTSALMIFESARGRLLVKLEGGVVDAVSEAGAPVEVEAGGVRIRAKGGSGAFEVAMAGRSLRVLARRGTVLAAAAKRTLQIAQGKTLKATLARPWPAAGAGHLTAVMIVAGAAGAVGLAAAVHSLSGSSQQSCVSPSQMSCP